AVSRAEYNEPAARTRNDAHPAHATGRHARPARLPCLAVPIPGFLALEAGNDEETHGLSSASANRVRKSR
ncbi:MAG: hypothetical protein ACREMA_07460, partial [Longimicrobiales bacterium]